MKLTISTQELLTKLDPCARVAEKKDKGTQPLTRCVLLTASPCGLELQAFCPPVSIRANIISGLDVSVPGRIAVHADEFLRRIKALEDVDVSLEAGKSRLVVRGPASRRRYEMGYFDGATFPAFPIVAESPTSLPATVLSSVLARTSYAAAIGDTYVEFNGVELRGDGARLTATASDRHRMARASEECTATLRVFVPQPAAKVLRESLGDGGVGVAASNSTFCAAFDGIELACSRAAVESPPYDAVFALMGEINGPVFDRASLLREIHGITVDGTSKAYQVEMRVDGGVMTLRHRTESGEENVGQMTYDGAHQWYALVDARYAMETLRRLTGERVELCVPKVQHGIMGIRSGEGEMATIGLIRPDAVAWAKEAA